MSASQVKPAFLTKLSMERYGEPGSGEFILTKPLVFRSIVADTIIVVSADFVTDLASTPRWPIIYWLTGGTCDEAAVVHDWLYSTHAVSRKVADAVLSEASAAMKEPAWRRTIMWAGVRIGGGGPDHWGRGSGDAETAGTALIKSPIDDVYFG